MGGLKIRMSLPGLGLPRKLGVVAARLASLGNLRVPPPASPAPVAAPPRPGIFETLVGPRTMLGRAVRAPLWVAMMGIPGGAAGLTSPRRAGAKEPDGSKLVFTDEDLTNGTFGDPVSVVLEMLEDTSQRMAPEMAAPYIQAVVGQAVRVPAASTALDLFLASKSSSVAKEAIQLWQEMRDRLAASESAYAFHHEAPGFRHVTLLERPAFASEIELMVIIQDFPKPWVIWLVDAMLQAAAGSKATASNLAYIAESRAWGESLYLSHHIIMGLLGIARHNPSMTFHILARLKSIASSNPGAFAAEHIPRLRALSVPKEPPPMGGEAPTVTLARIILEFLQEDRPDLFLGD